MAVQAGRSEASHKPRSSADGAAASRWRRPFSRSPAGGIQEAGRRCHGPRGMENPSPRGRHWRPGGYRRDRQARGEPEARGGPKPLPRADLFAWSLRRSCRRGQLGNRCNPSRRAHRHSNPLLGCARERPTGARMRRLAQGRPAVAVARRNTAEEDLPPQRCVCHGLRTLPGHGRWSGGASPGIRQGSTLP